MALAVGGKLERRRAAQAEHWMWTIADEVLCDALRADAGVRALIAERIRNELVASRTSPGIAADEVVARFLEQRRG